MADQPMSNIECKLRIAGPEPVRSAAKKIGAAFQGTFRQRDTFFHDAVARLKLRVIDGRRAELIRYSRSNEASRRESRYNLTPVRWPRLVRLWLSLRRGRLVEVIKERAVWLWRGVRIHLDNVEGLGWYAELEAVVCNIGSIQEAERRCAEAMRHLGAAESDIEPLAYADLLLQKHSAD